MPDYTSKLQVPKPLDNGEIIDPALFRNAFDIVDASVGVYLCTSASRPAAPWEGMLISETDTGRLFARVSGQWKYYGGEAPRRKVNGASASVGASESVLVLGGVTFTEVYTNMVVGDWYRIDVNYKQGSTVANDRCGLNLRSNNTGAALAITDNLLRAQVFAPPVTGVQFDAPMLSYDFQATAATHTIGLTHLKSGGTGTPVTSEVTMRITRLVA